MKIIKKTQNLYSLKYTQINQVIKFGNFAIKITSFGRLTENQLNSLERFLLIFLKKNSSNDKNIKVWNLVKFNASLTKLSSESRMGKGKGSIYTKAVFFKPGTILFEFAGVTDQEIFKVFKFIKKKLPFKSILVKKI